MAWSDCRRHLTWNCFRLHNSQCTQRVEWTKMASHLFRKIVGTKKNNEFFSFLLSRWGRHKCKCEIRLNHRKLDLAREPIRIIFFFSLITWTLIRYIYMFQTHTRIRVSIERKIKKGIRETLQIPAASNSFLISLCAAFSLFYYANECKNNIIINYPTSSWE